jgi:hypothetical protein
MDEKVFIVVVMLVGFMRYAFKVILNESLNDVCIFSYFGDLSYHSTFRTSGMEENVRQA